MHIFLWPCPAAGCGSNSHSTACAIAAPHFLSWPPHPPCSNVFWHRIVIDEVQQQSSLLADGELMACHRWGLSGTPDNDNNREKPPWRACSSPCGTFRPLPLLLGSS